MSRPLKVFLSHAHADATAVRALHDRLVEDGADAWLDKEKLIPGQDWEGEIRKAVREADVVIVCLSKQFNQRGFRQKEVRWALDEAEMMPEGEIFIIPARLEECEILESLQKLHCVNLFEKGGQEKLIKSLRLRAKSIGATLKKNTFKEQRSSTQFRKSASREDCKKEENFLFSSFLLYNNWCFGAKFFGCSITRKISGYHFNTNINFNTNDNANTNNNTNTNNDTDIHPFSYNNSYFSSN